jgi:hypothetical protein
VFDPPPADLRIFLTSCSSSINEIIFTDPKHLEHTNRLTLFTLFNGVPLGKFNRVDFLDQPSPILAELFARNLRFDERRNLIIGDYLNFARKYPLVKFKVKLP